MFSCYTFVQMAQTADERLKVLRTPGVLGFVGNERRGAPIPGNKSKASKSHQREHSVLSRILLSMPECACEFAEGRWKASKESSNVQGGDQSLVVSLELLHRSISIQVEGYDIELV